MKFPISPAFRSIIVAVVVCAAGIYHYETTGPRELYPDTLPMIQADGLDKKTIVYRIVDRELAFHKSKRLLVDGKISDYKNIAVTPTYDPDDPEADIFIVTYSVQSKDKMWTDGSGIRGQDDWILDKSTYVRLEKDITRYRLVDLGSEL